jgi:hypothetical protein
MPCTTPLASLTAQLGAVIEVEMQRAYGKNRKTGAHSVTHYCSG